MIQDGLYKVDFQTQIGAGSGVVALRDGEVRGGDSGMFYVGSYRESGDEVSAEVVADTHSSIPEMHSVFGADKVTISLRGRSNGDAAQLSGSAKEAPGVMFQAILTRLSD